MRVHQARHKRKGEIVMKHPLHTLVMLVVLTTFTSRSEAAKDPTGHWEGTIQAPDREVAIEVDLTRTPQKTLAGTFSNLDRKIQGLPLSSVTAKGRTLRCVLGGRGGGTFDANVSADGKSMTGKFTTTTPQGEVALPFKLTRNGDARIELPPKNPPIRKELEGSWSGTLEAEGLTMRIQLELANQPDQTSAGSIANLDEGGAAIPITTISEQDGTLKLEVRVVGGSFTGALGESGAELTGTWTQAGMNLPVTFRRASSPEKK
jgi:hypothetical protein